MSNNIIEVTNTIIKESKDRISVISRKSGVKSQTISHWKHGNVNDALISNVDAVLNACGYALAIVRRCDIIDD